MPSALAPFPAPALVFPGGDVHFCVFVFVFVFVAAYSILTPFFPYSHGAIAQARGGGRHLKMLFVRLTHTHAIAWTRTSHPIRNVLCLNKAALTSFQELLFAGVIRQVRKAIVKEVDVYKARIIGNKFRS